MEGGTFIYFEGTATLGGPSDCREHRRPSRPGHHRPDSGLWVTPRSWEHWIEYYEGRGYRVLAPACPGLEVEVEALTETPPRSRL